MARKFETIAKKCPALSHEYRSGWCRLAMLDKDKSFWGSGGDVYYKCSKKRCPIYYWVREIMKDK